MSGRPVEQSVSPQRGFEKLNRELTEMLVYYHLVLTIYRPFLIIESTLRSAGKSDQIEMLWLRPACRQATAAAEDCLALMHQTRQIVDVKQVSWNTGHQRN